MPDDSSATENEILDKLNSSRNKVKKWSSLIAGMTSSLAVAMTLALGTNLFFDKTKTLTKQELTEQVLKIEQQITTQRKEIQSINNNVSQVRIGLENISKLPKGAEWQTETSRISQNLNEVTEKIKFIEDALTVKPLEALAIPMLRKDLDNTEKTLRAELTQTRLEIERMYDQNKWFIGLMFTIALSVLGMAISSFMNRKDG